MEAPAAPTLWTSVLRVGAFFRLCPGISDPGKISKESVYYASRPEKLVTPAVRETPWGPSHERFELS